MMVFEAVDFWGLESEFSEEEIQIRNAVRTLVDRDVLPIIGQCFEEGRFPMHLIPSIAKMGLLGANLRGYGCPGIGEVAYGLVMQELERGDSGIRSFASVQGALAMYPIYTFGSEEQRQQWLPGMASGEIIGCFGLTESDFGSNPAGMRTNATKSTDRWIINGSKMWITNGNIAQVAVIWARTEEGFRGFVVPTDTPGFRARLVEHKFSLRASVTSELTLDNVEVPLDAVLPNVLGLKGALACLSAARYGISWGVVGSAMAVYDEALRYAKERVQFSRPIAGYQLVQEKLVEMLTEISKAQLVNLRMGRMKERGQLRPHHISFAKRNNVAMARRVAQLGREILGANGIMYDYQVGRHLCNIETVYTYEGTHDIHTLILGKEITNIAAFDS